MFVDRVLPSLNVIYIDDTVRGKALAAFKRFSRHHRVGSANGLTNAFQVSIDLSRQRSASSIQGQYFDVLEYRQENANPVLPLQLM